MERRNLTVDCLLVCAMAFALVGCSSDAPPGVANQPLPDPGKPESDFSSADVVKVPPVTKDIDAPPSVVNQPLPDTSKPKSDSSSADVVGDPPVTKDIDIPDGVNYTYATDELNAKAKEKIRIAFSHTAENQRLQTIFGDRLICGPYLWDQIKSDKTVAEIKQGHVIFQVPVLEQGKVVRMDRAEGKLFQSEDEIAAFSNAFSNVYHYDEARSIRKLTAQELNLHWSMISWDISEPIFVVESESHKILLSIVADELTVLWIDDYQVLSTK